jgi:hypothetical protein
LPAASREYNPDQHTKQVRLARLAPKYQAGGRGANIVCHSGPFANCADGPFARCAWAALYSTMSYPFDKPNGDKIAVKVINDYGNEVLKVYAV